MSDWRRGYNAFGIISFEKKYVVYIKIVINNMSDQGTSVPAAPSQPEIDKCREIVTNADMEIARLSTFYLGIDSLPKPTDEDIEKYITDFIKPANKEMLQKIISKLEHKFRMSVNKRNSTDENIFSAASEKLQTLKGGRPKPSKKRSTHRRRRSSKARKSRKTRTTRRR